MPPLTFVQAKARVSPDAPVEPGSKEHLEIIELMRQSGVVFAEDNVPPPPPPPAKSIEDFKPFREREAPTPKPKAISKMEWLSLPSNKKAFDEHLDKHRAVPKDAYVPEPEHISWAGKTPPKIDRPMSKREWVSLLK